MIRFSSTAPSTLKAPQKAKPKQIDIAGAADGFNLERTKRGPLFFNDAVKQIWKADKNEKEQKSKNKHNKQTGENRINQKQHTTNNKNSTKKNK